MALIRRRSYDSPGEDHATIGAHGEAPLMTIDPVTVEILRNHYQAIVEDMARIMERTAYTTFVKETADFSTGLVSAGGDYVAYPANLAAPSYLGLNIAHTLAYFDHYDARDILVCIDAYLSAPLGTPLPVIPS